MNKFLKFFFLFFVVLLDVSNATEFDDTETGKPKSIVVLAYCAVVSYPDILKEKDNADIVLICSDNEKFPDKKTLHLYKKIYRTNAFYESGFVEQVIFDLAKNTTITAIISGNEWDVLRAAALREMFNVEGQNFTSALAFRDKVIMKDILSKKGIRVPPYQKLRGTVDVLSFVSIHGYPVVIKPTREAGAKGINVIYNESDLKFFLESNHPVTHHAYETTYEIERFVKGKIFNINGLIYQGKCVAVWPSAGLNTCLDLVRGKLFASYIVEEKHPLKVDLCEFACRVIEALPSPGGCAFHLEAIYDADNQQLYFLEIASRLGGGAIRQSWNQCFNIDLLIEHIRLSANLPPNCNKKKLLDGPDFIVGDVWIPPQIGTLKKIPESCPFNWVLNYYPEMKPGKKVNQMSRISDNLALTVIKASSEEKFLEYVKIFESWFQENTVFE